MALSAGRGATTSGEGLRESRHHTEKKKAKEKEEAKEAKEEEEGILTKSLEREREGGSPPHSISSFARAAPSSSAS